jgi:hypothetical protein
LWRRLDPQQPAPYISAAGGTAAHDNPYKRRAGFRALKRKE